MSLLKWALIFLVVSIIAAVFGFTGISAASADIARILFYIFVIIFIGCWCLGWLPHDEFSGHAPVLSSIGTTVASGRAKS